MFPAVPRIIKAPTGGDAMQGRMVVAIAAMRVEHDDVATPQRVVPDRAIEIVQALGPTPHQGAPEARGIVVERHAEQREDRQDDGPIDPPRVEDLAHLAAPVVRVHFGTPDNSRTGGAKQWF